MKLSFSYSRHPTLYPLLTGPFDKGTYETNEQFRERIQHNNTFLENKKIADEKNKQNRLYCTKVKSQFDIIKNIDMINYVYYFYNDFIDNKIFENVLKPM